MTFRFNCIPNGRADIAPVMSAHAALRYQARITIKRLSLLIALLAVSVAATAQSTSIVGTWDASLSMSASLGRYSVDPVKHTISFPRDRSSMPNPDDESAVDSYELKGDELSWKVAPQQDGSVPITALRWVK